MPIDIETVDIKKGNHTSPDQGACVMEWVSIFAGEPFSDHPECTDAVVAAYARALNDVMPDTERHRLRPYIPRLAATRNGCPPETRAFLCADAAVRVFAVAALRSPGLEDWADQLAGLAPITDGAAAWAAASAASDAAWAASDAASAAWAAWAASDATSAAWAAASAASGAAWAASDAASAASAAASAASDAASAASDAASAATIWDEALALLDRLIEAH